MKNVIEDHEYNKPSDDGIGTIVIFDERKGVVLDRTPLLNPLKRPRYYTVTTGVSSEPDLKRISIRDVKGNDLHLLITYQVRCKSGNEAKAIAAMARGQGGVQKSFESSLEDWIDTFIDARGLGRTEFIHEYYDIRSELIRFIRSKAEDTVFLQADIDVCLEGEQELEVFRVDNHHVTGKTQDSDQDVDLRVTADLEVDAEQRIHAVLMQSKLSELNRELTLWIREYLRNQRLDDVCFRMSETLVPELRQQLNKKLAKWGRYIAYFSVNLAEQFSLPDRALSIMRHVVEIEVREITGKVKVTHGLSAQLQSFALCQHANLTTTSAVEEWLKTKLNEHTRDRLFGKTYADLVLEFDEEPIRRLITADAERIGYRVELYSVLPDIEPLLLRHEGFECKINEDFSTKDIRIKVGIEIDVRGQILDLSKDAIRRRIKPNAKLFEQIRNTIIEAARWTINRLTPEQFYRHFDDASELENGMERKSVSQLLRESIQEHLIEQFAASDVAVESRIDRSDLTQRITDLCHGFHEVNIEAQPLADGGNAPKVTFRMVFKVQGIAEDGWAIFQSNSGYIRHTQDGKVDISAEIVAIKSVLSESVRGDIELIPQDILQYKEKGIKNKIDQIIGNSCRDVAKSFGLVIDIVEARRLLTGQEEYHRKQIERSLEAAEIQGQSALEWTKKNLEADLDDIDSLRNSIRAMREKRDQRATQSGVDPEELDELDEQIQRLEAKIQHADRGVNSLPAPNPSPNVKDRFDFGDFLGSSGKDAIEDNRRTSAPGLREKEAEEIDYKKDDGPTKTG